MKKTFTILSAAAFALAVFTFSSCKKDNNSNQQFIAHYDGIANSTISPGNSPDTAYVTAGSNNSSIVVNFASTSNANILATVSGNNINVPAQYITPDGDSIYISSGSGTLTNGKTLYFTINDSILHYKSGVSTFNGTKE